MDIKKTGKKLVNKETGARFEIVEAGGVEGILTADAFGVTSGQPVIWLDQLVMAHFEIDDEAKRRIEYATECISRFLSKEYGAGASVGAVRELVKKYSSIEDDLFDDEVLLRLSEAVEDHIVLTIQGCVELRENKIYAGKDETKHNGYDILFAGMHIGTVGVDKSINYSNRTLKDYSAKKIMHMTNKIINILMGGN